MQRAGTIRRSTMVSLELDTILLSQLTVPHKSVRFQKWLDIHSQLVDSIVGYEPREGRMILIHQGQLC